MFPPSCISVASPSTGANRFHAIFGDCKTFEPKKKLEKTLTLLPNRLLFIDGFPLHVMFLWLSSLSVCWVKFSVNKKTKTKKTRNLMCKNAQLAAKTKLSRRQPRSTLYTLRMESSGRSRMDRTR
jgi:hypothetical protein